MSFCKIFSNCALRQDSTIKLKEAILNLNVVSIVNNAFFVFFCSFRWAFGILVWEIVTFGKFKSIFNLYFI